MGGLIDSAIVVGRGHEKRRERRRARRSFTGLIIAYCVMKCLPCPCTWYAGKRKTRGQRLEHTGILTLTATAGVQMEL